MDSNRAIINTNNENYKIYINTTDGKTVYTVSANGEAILTSIGKTSAISYANKEYIKTVYIA